MKESILNNAEGIALFIVGGVLFATIALTTARFIRPNRPDDEKLSTYECGEETVGMAWGVFNFRYYIVALLFILFEVELVMLVPVVSVFGDKNHLINTSNVWAVFVWIEAMIFVVILAIGLAFAWKKGYLDWVLPEPKKSTFKGPVPTALYNSVNNRNYPIKQQKHTQETI